MRGNLWTVVHTRVSPAEKCINGDAITISQLSATPTNVELEASNLEDRTQE